MELAGARRFWAAPAPLRRIWMAPFRSLPFPPSHARAYGRALEPHDARGARTGPAKMARTLRRWDSRRGKPGARKPIDGNIGRAKCEWHLKHNRGSTVNSR